MMNRYKFVSRSKVVAKKKLYHIKAKVWLYTGMAGWHFVTIPVKVSKEIKREFGGIARGWGSIPVLVTIGRSSWKTSIFPDKKARAYLLPLKADIRKKEDIHARELISFSLSI